MARPILKRTCSAARVTAHDCGYGAEPHGCGATGAVFPAPVASVRATQGLRRQMEDSHALVPDCATPFFAVFDGHGGSQCAEYLRDHLYSMILKHPELKTHPDKAIYDSIIAADRQFLQRSEEETNESGSAVDLRHAGAACAVGLIAQRTLYVANVGDAEAMLYTFCRPPAALTQKHTLASPDEKARVLEAGGRLAQGCRVRHPQRLYVNLELTRSVGDAHFKLPQLTGGSPSGVVAEPSLCAVPLELLDTDSASRPLLVLACDGLWSVFSLADVSAHLDASLTKLSPVTEGDWEGVLGHLCEELLCAALGRGSSDNITVLIARL